MLTIHTSTQALEEDFSHLDKFSLGYRVDNFLAKIINTDLASKKDEQNKVDVYRCVYTSSSFSIKTSLGEWVRGQVWKRLVTTEVQRLGSFSKNCITQ